MTDLKKIIDKAVWKMRFVVANYLVRIANKIYKKHPDVMKFYIDSITDHLIYGKTVTRIEQDEFTFRG